MFATRTRTSEDQLRLGRRSGGILYFWSFFLGYPFFGVFLGFLFFGVFFGVVFFCFCFDLYHHLCVCFNCDVVLFSYLCLNVPLFVMCVVDFGFAFGVG